MQRPRPCLTPLPSPEPSGSSSRPRLMALLLKVLAPLCSARRFHAGLGSGTRRHDPRTGDLRTFHPQSGLSLLQHSIPRAPQEPARPAQLPFHMAWGGLDAAQSLLLQAPHTRQHRRPALVPPMMPTVPTGRPQPPEHRALQQASHGIPTLPHPSTVGAWRSCSAELHPRQSLLMQRAASHRHARAVIVCSDSCLRPRNRSLRLPA
mmetsp:Transcript_21390/g.59328  ORF Transcript_21390/g.59328 Transcript_21390/m.59328 type:complete len:206 (+) Transcript_21390:668-1285(+)